MEIYGDTCAETYMKNNCILSCHFDDPVNFENSQYLHAFEMRQHFDIVIMDSQDKSFLERITCFNFLEPYMVKDPLMILDDFWRYEILLKKNKAKKVEIYESIGACRYGVTSTAFFYY